ncbi:prolyl aminopeptidase [Thiorhodococcus minor]|uniref:Proline iminopeptidase n=1 Tax=Thiorhodococcus minor TaxID=57489 RepID=A0A6M0K7D7_9GAMM|nr:prolyl aminopeptidase [Thiorhodococcus minor]NEV64285.1 prolyl aminopeptidase [Thiorhodococcus minor]
MTGLHPPIAPFRVHQVARDHGHRVYVEECGHPSGLPVVFLHGGPGSGCSPAHRRLFDPASYRVVLVDQRGSGRSTPLGETAANRTPDLVADLEAVREMLGIERWLLFGGSWGATLALAYARSHVDRVLGMVLRGVFLARATDLAWFFGAEGAARLFPEDWAAFSAHGESADWAALIETYDARMHGQDSAAAVLAAYRWSAWGERVVTWTGPQPLGPARLGPRGQVEGRRAGLLAKARIETHYARHRYFLDGDGVLGDLSELPSLPVTLVQGQRDLVCPLEGAWRLHQALPSSKLRVLADAGHLIWEPAMMEALMQETDALRRRLG